MHINNAINNHDQSIIEKITELILEATRHTRRKSSLIDNNKEYFGQTSNSKFDKSKQNKKIKLLNDQDDELNTEYSQKIKQKKNIGSNSALVERLYTQNQEHEFKLLQLKKKKIMQEEAKLIDFKVKNKKSIQINEKKHLKNIIDRTPQILREREEKINIYKLRNRSKQDQVLDKSPQKKYHKQEIQSFQKKNEDWQNKKNQTISIKKMENLNLIFSRIKQKPDINDYSKQIIKKSSLNEKKFLQRTQIYQQNKTNKISQLKKELNKSLLPFQPTIDKNSFLIASKSQRNLRQSNVFCRISKSPSKNNISTINKYNQTSRLDRKSASILTLREEINKQKSLLKTSTGQDSNSRIMSTNRHNNSKQIQQSGTRNKKEIGIKKNLNQKIETQKKYIKQVLSENKMELMIFLRDLLQKQKANNTAKLTSRIER